MHIDPYIVLGSAIIGLLVGMTGAGGGALMTPMLILLFGVTPAAAISSDLVAAVVMRPFGAGVHLRAGTVNLRLVRWMVIGSVPAAFLGAYLLHVLGNSKSAQTHIETVLGIALLIGASAMVLRFVLDRRSGQNRLGVVHDLKPRPLPTVVIGIVGGVIVGLTSVGSGSLMIVLLLFRVPDDRRQPARRNRSDSSRPADPGRCARRADLRSRRGRRDRDRLIIGSVPAVLVGSMLSSTIPDRYVRPVIAFVIFASGLKYVGLETTALGWTLCALLFAGAGTWLYFARPWQTRVARSLRSHVDGLHSQQSNRQRRRDDACRRSRELTFPSPAGRWRRSASATAPAGRRARCSRSTASPATAAPGWPSLARSGAARRCSRRISAAAAPATRFRRRTAWRRTRGICSRSSTTSSSNARCSSATHSARMRSRGSRPITPNVRAARSWSTAGSPLPAPPDVDPQAVLDAVLGPALERLRLTFPGRDAYRDWWRSHPAFASSDVSDEDLIAYADHDLVGEPPQLRSSVQEGVIRADATELLEIGKPAHRLKVPAVLLCAERGMVDDPNPLQPPGLARPWADAAPESRRMVLVAGVNHYTIVMGAAGAGAVAAEIVRALQSPAGDRHLRSAG